MWQEDKSFILFTSTSRKGWEGFISNDSLFRMDVAVVQPMGSSSPVPRCSGGDGTRPSVAAARLHHHVPVLLEDDVVVAVVVEDRGGAELRGGTARLGHGLGLHQVDLRDGWSPSVLRAGGKHRTSS